MVERLLRQETMIFRTIAGTGSSYENRSSGDRLRPHVSAFYFAGNHMHISPSPRLAQA